MASDKPSLMPGEVLDDKYQIDRVIGEGGMGIVYEATHAEIGRKVAIKRLHKTYTTDSQIVERFHREARLAGSIGHDNICEVTDIGRTADGAPYLVMPLLSGASLSQLLKESRPMPLLRVVDILCQTLSALDAAHRARIVHRDLKPDNIFVIRVGDREDFVKLLDFGISKILDQESVGKLTRTGTVMGTPYYMSPEQAKGSKTIDHRTDIYAMGVILYEALTGQRPFEGDTYNEVMFKILTEPFPHPRSLNASIPAGVERVILGAMSRDPAERYQTAEEMRFEIEKAVTEDLGQSMAASTNVSTAVSARTPFTPGRLRGRVSAATPMPKAAISSPSSSVPSFGPQSRHRGLVVGIVIALLAVASVVLVLVYTRSETPSAVPVPLYAPPMPAEKIMAPQAPAASEASPAAMSAEPSKPVAPAVDAEHPEPELERTTIAQEKPRHPRSKTASRKTSSETKPKDESDKGLVKGRARTSIVSDYEE